MNTIQKFSLRSGVWTSASPMDLNWKILALVTVGKQQKKSSYSRDVDWTHLTVNQTSRKARHFWTVLDLNSLPQSGKQLLWKHHFGCCWLYDLIWLIQLNWIKNVGGSLSKDFSTLSGPISKPIHGLTARPETTADIGTWATIELNESYSIHCN